MTTAADILAEARTWLGTPFHHQGRLKGVGADCLGLVVGVGRVLGLSDADGTGYPRQPDGRALLAASSGMIHVHAAVGRVVETGLDAGWAARLVAAYRYPGVES